MKQAHLFFSQLTLIVLIFICISIDGIAQFEVLPCDDPDNNGVGCYCETAGILCTPDLLDGFEFAMSETENFGDLGDGTGGMPDDLCPGTPSDGMDQGGVPNNVNFFAFIVWCEELTFNVLVNNCADNPLDNFVTYGIQMALFANCPAANGGSWDPVSCITSGGISCFDTEAEVPTSQTFTASGLEIGATYYFMVDGCALSTCKVTIDVQGVCGDGEITDWDTGLTGATSVCVGDTESYVAEDILVGLDGAEEYYYYLDGSLIETGEEIYEIDVTWDTPGSFELCVDVSNLPCIEESDFPAQDCITIFVNGPGNGEVIADPAILCPDETSNISVVDNNSDPAQSNYIIIVGPDGTVVQIVESLTTTLTYDLCGEFIAYYYSFITADNPTLPAVGDVWTLPDCLADCCSLDDTVITFEDTEDPVFPNEPPNITLNCPEDIPADELLTWTDNCAGTGEVPPIVVNNFTFCLGGTVERTWSFTDSCSNDVSYTQTITLEAVPPPIFTTMPGDSIIDCDIAQIFEPLILEYTNSATGTCEISGMVTPTSVGSFDICGSSVTYTWMYEDDCSREIIHSQVVTVQEVGEANAFINPPDDITISCEEWLTFTPATLSYSNGQSGSCEISGFEDAVTMDTHDPCGSSITYTWFFEDMCGREITESQVVTVEPKPEATYVNPPVDVTINCDELQTFMPAVLTYTNGGTGTCLIEGTIDPVITAGELDICGGSVTYTWTFEDDCDRPALVHSQTVTIEPIPEAAYVNPPDDITINCDELQTFMPAVLMYTNSGTGACLIEGTVDPVITAGELDICGGSVTYEWTFEDDCGRPALVHSQTVTIEPIPEAAYVNPPADVTINCDELQTFMPAVLMYTNSGTGACLIDGTVDPVITAGELDICGGSVTYEWTFEDDCGRPALVHSQTVTIEPIPEAAYVNPPDDVTINCDELQTFMPAVLTYTNGGTGTCLIEGTVDPLIESGELDICGGSVTYTWTFEDDCDRPDLVHTQTVTVDPIAEAAYVNPPDDVTINCDELQTFAPEVLSYTNGGTGTCLIEGTVDPVIESGELDICGGSVTYTWTFEDDCDRPALVHSQTVTVDPIPEAAYVNPPADVTINCDELQTFTPEVLSYTNGGTGTCLIEGTVDPVIESGELDICGGSVTYTWTFQDDCDRPALVHSQTVTVDPIPEAAYVNPPADVTIDCDELQTFAPEVLNYTNGGTGSCLIEGTVDPVIESGELDICGGSVTYTWTFQDDCDRPALVHTQMVTVLPIPEASYIDPPGSITINCDELQTFVPAVLSYTNGGAGSCLIEGTVDPVTDGELDICGGSVTYTWTFEDDCDRPALVHTQTVTVEPIVAPEFIDPPADVTVDCASKPNEGEGPLLSYTNGGTDACETAGEIMPIEVYDVTECGGTIVYTWTFTDDCDNAIIETQTITVDRAPQAQLENLPPSSITIECNENSDTGPDLVVTNNETGDCLIEDMITPTKVGDAGNCGGSFQFVWEFLDDCGLPTSFTQTVNVNRAPVAAFDNLPADIDIDCAMSTDVPEDLPYTNGDSGDCEISGSVPGVRTGVIDYCGGTLVDTWEFIDECGHTISAQRDVNVAAAPSAEYINPPADVTVNCTNVNSISTQLNYNNGGAGICLISGVSTAVVSGSYDACGGALIYTWSFLDDCGRAISESQNITVDPAPDPAYIDPPADLVVGCDDTYAGPEILNYTNGAGGTCEIFGAIIPITTQVDNVITNTWELILPCSGDILTHVQEVTLSIKPEITVNPNSVFLCLGESYDLADVIVTETNGTMISLTYHNAFPPTPSNEITSIVNPTSDFIYVINAVNEFGCEDFELVNIFIEEPPFAGDDQSTTVCSDGFPLNLFDFIPPFADQNGSWLDLDGIGANISNPFGATFNSVLPGNYSLYYVVFSTTVCENDTMVLNVEVIEDVMFEVTEVTCIGANDFYEVYLNSNGFDIQATEGTLMNITGNEYVVTNIPITTGVLISAFESVSGCSATVFVDIPNCDCPEIDPPTGNNVSFCVDEQPIVLSVNVPGGMTANWFYEQNDNIPFLTGSTDFTVQDSMAGIYSFYVETYDPATDCYSNTKVKIDIEINDLPEAIDAVVNICDLENNGTETISLQSYNASTNNNPANTFTYFETFVNADTNTDPLPDAFDLNIGSNILFVRIENSANCVNIAEIDLVLTDLPDAEVTANAPSCIGDEDGVIFITALDVSGVMMTSLDGITFTTDIQYNGLAPGAYTVYVQDENECLSTYDIVIPEGLDILFTTFTSECNDNGTNTDPSDDFYTITLFIENNNGNTGSYRVIFDGSTQFTYSYGSNESFTIPADQENNIDIVIADVDFLCTQDQTFGPLNPCSTNCEISIDVLEFECDDNGTDTDPTDDFAVVTINASALNGSTNNTYNVFVDGVLLYNFTYGQDATFEVAADGGNVNITCQDNQDIQCQTSQDIGPIAPCSGGCQVLLNIIDDSCNDNGTSTIETDDFYTFTINGSIINGDDLTQYELFVDGVSQGLFNYDEDVDVDVVADGMIHMISINDSSNEGCTDSFTTSNLSNCSTDCEIILNESDEECINNGTPQDSSDDYYEFTINASANNGATNQLFNLYVDGTFIDDYPYNMDNIITIAADGEMHTILIQDSEQLTCELSFETITLISCSEGCLNELSVEDFECFDNGTATNVNDDFYEFSLLGTLLNGDNNSSFNLFVDGVLENTYSYGDLISITLPADDEVHTILIVDTNNSSCTSEIQTDVLVSCSTDCEIISDDILYTCFNNGTPTDPSDDFIEMTINASAINGSTTNMYNLYFDGILEGIFTYGTPETFTIPAENNKVITLRFQDSQDLQCDLEVDTDVLKPCSDDCLIGITIINFMCLSNDTPTDVSDDFYEFTITGEVLNGMPSNSFEVFVDNVSQGAGNYGDDFVVTIPADGMVHIINIEDGDDSMCFASFTTSELTSCSTDCEISMNDLVFGCENNGTLDDPNDDFYEISFTAEAINGSTGYSLTIFGVVEGNYNYGELVELTLPADGSNLILILTDLGDPQCVFNQAVGALGSCSDLCTIEPMILESQCFDNMTPIDPTDDYWEITIFVNPANGVNSPNYELSVDGTVDGIYPYSENVIITIPAGPNTYDITVVDTDDINCDASVTTSVLTPCSTPCEISASFDNATCNNNGTNDTSDDDIYFVDILVSNPSAGQFQIPSLSINGDYNETINIGPFNIADENILEIFDASQNLCFIELELIPPPPCSECAQEVDAGVGGEISCDVTEIPLLGTSSEAGQYSWFGPAGNLVSSTLDATATNIGVYIFSVIYDDGCMAEDSVEIIADVDLPIASLASDGAITCEKTTTVLDGSESGTTDDFFFYWFDQDGELVSEDQMFETDVPGVYSLQVESKDNNCKSALEAVVVESQVNEPIAVIYAEPSNVIDCVIETIVLTTDVEENVNYIWSVNGTLIDETVEIEISEIGNYGLLAIDTITGCTNEADLIITSLIDYPIINLEAANILDCDNEEVTIEASTLAISEDFTSFWQDENGNLIVENQNSLTVSSIGQYFYTLIDNVNGCENTDSIVIEMFEDVLDIEVEPEIIYLEGQSVLLSATVTLDESEIDSISWFPNENMTCPTCLITQVSDPTDSLYTITVKDIYGCVDTAQVRLIRKEEPEIFIPNIINVGSNAGNDKFTIYGNEEVDRILKLKIFDRWGNAVYIVENQELNIPGSGWDATFNGQNVEQGVYVYILEALFLNGDIEVYHGDLTVIW